MKYAPVLALDLATRTGWAVGTPGEKCQPISGSIRFASPKSSHEAVFAHALTWMKEMCELHAPGTIVWEAPLPTSFKRGSTNADTTTLLFGLPAVIGAVAFLMKIYDIRKASTSDVRNHFIGQNPRGVIGKRLTMQQCRVMGWTFETDDEADALALWSYMASLRKTELAIIPTPLFGRRP